MKLSQPLLLLFVMASFMAGCHSQHKMMQPEAGLHFTGNPVLPGNFADPFILVEKDSFYIYATGGGVASVWRSADFVNWKLTKLNWPTSMKLPDIWAPAVTKGNDGRFYLYTSVNHNIYVGVADHPTGPFANVLGSDSIFIKNRQWWPKIHSIDADCFLDDDGEAYLYWGSGFDFKDGVCGAGRLGKDMASFAEQPKLVTPSGYFEGPHMMKRQGKYYLMYSDGLFYDSTYKIRYAVSSSPLGPFTEGKNSPILVSTPDGLIHGPGHHSTFHKNGNDYIVYHRHTQPLYPGGNNLMRQVCIDRLEFEEDGSVKKIKGTQEGVPLDFTVVKNQRHLLTPVAATASSNLGASYDAKKAFDGSFGTLWAAGKNEVPASLTADFGKQVTIISCEPFFDQIMGEYKFRLDYSSDGSNWLPYAEGNNAMANEWPMELVKKINARYLRLTLLNQVREPRRVGVWELNVYGE